MMDDTTMCSISGAKRSAVNTHWAQGPDEMPLTASFVADPLLNSESVWILRTA